MKFLESRLDRRARVFEYGSGGSTIFLGSRAGHVISVEHDRNWSNEVTQTAAALGLPNVTVLLVEPSLDLDAVTTEAGDPDAYVSSESQFAGKTFRAYAATIDQYSDGEFQVILIDGRARPSCFKHSLPKLAPGGIIMLDNAERVHYRYIHKTLDDLGWCRHEFAGAGPYNQHFWKTTAWNRPEY
jgi:precorrin-6B methylase 2